MAVFVGKQWLRDNLVPYLKIIKTELNTLGNVTGQYAGVGATQATLPTVDAEGAPLLAGDWSVQSADEVGTGTAEAPQFPAGVYVRNAANGWDLVQENTDLGDILLAIMATDAEVTAGTATDKVASVLQLKTFYSLINGSATEEHLVKPGEIDSDEATNANQFSSTDVTDVEGQSDWDAIVV